MEPKILVFDNGSYMSKVGFAGDNSPRATFHSIVGTNQSDRNCPLIAGDNALTMLNISNPIQSGIITKWDEMEKVYISQFICFFLSFYLSSFTDLVPFLLRAAT